MQPAVETPLPITSHDVAAYILQERGPMSAMKLQKLLYYAQAWSLVWDDRPLFPERIEAWVNGPVVKEIYAAHKGRFALHNWPQGDAAKLTGEARETVDKVIAFYAPHDAQWLSDLSHREEPWLRARQGLAVGERGASEITHESMMEYYSSLP